MKKKYVGFALLIIVTINSFCFSAKGLAVSSDIGITFTQREMNGAKQPSEDALPGTGDKLMGLLPKTGDEWTQTFLWLGVIVLLLVAIVYVIKTIRQNRLLTKND